MAGSLVRLSRESAASRLLERGRRLPREVCGRRAVELGEQGRGMIEVVSADLEQLVSGPLRSHSAKLA